MKTVFFTFMQAVMFLFNRFLYKPWSKMWRFFLDRKYTEMPDDLPWTRKQLESFFESCVWTEDPVKGSIDYFMKPERFYFTERGDCDDYSVFAASVLDPKMVIGILTVQWWVPADKKKKFHGHNVCLIEEDNKLYHIGNWGTWGPYESIEEAMESIAQVRTGNILLGYGLRDKDLNWVEII